MTVREDGGVGLDLPPRKCSLLTGKGVLCARLVLKFPFETLLGFGWSGTKKPDIDLNFSGRISVQLPMSIR